MRYEQYIFIQIIWLISPISGAFKDFVIENEQDLERFGLPNTEYYDDDIGFDLLSEGIYGDEYFENNADGCDAAGADRYGNGAEYNVGIEGIKNGEITADLLKQIVKQMQNDPRFEHLKDQLTEENFMLDFKRQEVDQKLSHRYVDFEVDNYVQDKFE